MSIPNFEEPDYEEAVKVCRDLGRISVIAIQRHLRMGYVKACLIVEAMGERGIAEQVDPDGAWVFTANARPHAEAIADSVQADVRQLDKCAQPRPSVKWCSARTDDGRCRALDPFIYGTPSCDYRLPNDERTDR